MAVKKYGRSTGLTKGAIDAIDVTITIAYGNPEPEAQFINQIIIIGDLPGPFNRGGDSGSLVVVSGGPDGRRPVGLLFAGADNLTVANPIKPVLERFGATIAR
jgi:hypothetical protein